MHFTSRQLLTRIAAPAVLLAMATSGFLMGGNSLAHWTVGIATKTGLGVERSVRVLMAAQLIAAAYGLLFPGLSVAIAWITFGALAFTGLAELSSLVAAPGDGPIAGSLWVMPLAALAIGAAGMVLLGRTRAPADEGPAPALNAWRVFIGLFVIGGALSIAARVVVSERTPPNGFAVHPASAVMPRGVESIVLNTEEWIGKTIPETGLGRFVPELTAATLEGTKWIVFYQPSCGRCHEIFRVYFKGPQHQETIALIVPRQPDVEEAVSDQPADVECEECIRLALPEGKRWILTTPTILKVENGRITCATSSDYTRCRRASDELP